MGVDPKWGLFPICPGMSRFDTFPGPKKDKRGSADCKRGRRKGATSKIVKKCQNVFRHFSTINVKRAKNVKKCQKVSKSFSTLFARHLFSGPFCNPLRGQKEDKSGHSGTIWETPPVRIHPIWLSSKLASPKLTLKMPPKLPLP